MAPPAGGAGRASASSAEIDDRRLAASVGGRCWFAC